MAATLALKDGNADSIREQLPPEHREAFNLALAVQQMRGDNAETESARRLNLRTQDEIEKRRAASEAADAIVAEEKAALYAAADADGDTLALMSSADLDDLPEAEMLVEDFLVKESIVRLFGPPKTYKSFIMLDIAANVGGGTEWHGKRVRKSKVLYVVAEGVRGIRRRARAWEVLNKRSMDGVEFYGRAIQLTDRKEMTQLIRTVKRGDFGLIILDTQARCTVGLEENSPKEMGVVAAGLDVLKEVTGACVALVHHSGVTPGRARGTNSMLGALDAEFEVEADKDSMTLAMHTRAQKDLVESPSIDFELVSMPIVKPDGVTPDGTSLAVRAKRGWYQARPEDLAPLSEEQMLVLRTIDNYGNAGATNDAVAKDMKRDRNEVRAIIGGQLMRKGIVRMKGEKFFVDKVGRVHLSGTLDSVRED